MHHGAPFLSVVFVSRSYSTSTRGLRGTYADGSAISAGNYDGGLFDPPLDFAKMAEAANLASTYVGRMRPEYSGVKMEEVKKHPKGTSIGSAAPTMTTFSITGSIAP